MSQTRSPRALFHCAAAVIVFAGLKVAGEILVPFLFSLVLAALAQPIVRRLARYGIPNVASVLLTVMFLVFGGLALAGLLGGSLASFTQDLPQYREGFQGLADSILALLEKTGIMRGDASLREAVASAVDPAAAVDFVGSLVSGLIGLLSNSVLVTLTLVFLLLEAQELHPKIARAFTLETATNLSGAAQKVQQYLGLKTAVSLLTGVLLGGWTAVVGLEHPVLWGLMAFLFNFIPAIGSILAALPPLLLAWVGLGGGSALLIALGYGAVNLGVGNFLEPRLMGRSLGLSPLVVFLSLLFWGWVFGPAGMLLSVPLTVIAKILLESNPNSRSIAILLGPAKEVDLDRT